MAKNLCFPALGGTRAGPGGRRLGGPRGLAGRGGSQGKQRFDCYTRDTYGYHLAKLRWYCESVGRVTPSRWAMQDVEAFYKFLDDFSDDGCVRRAMDTTRCQAKPATRRSASVRQKAASPTFTASCTPCSKPGTSMGYICIVVDAGSCQPPWPRECGHDDDLYRPGCP